MYQEDTDDCSTIIDNLTEFEHALKVPIFPSLKQPSCIKRTQESTRYQEDFTDLYSLIKDKDTTQMIHLLPSVTKKQIVSKEDSLTFSTKLSIISGTTIPSNNFIVNNQLTKIRKYIGTPQRQEIEGGITQNLIIQPGKLIFMLHIEWATGYTDYLQHKTSKIQGPINNNGIFSDASSDDINYKQNLKQDQDFVLLNRNTWMFINSLYGGGPEVNYNDYAKEVHGIIDPISVDGESVQALFNNSLTFSRMSSVGSSRPGSYISIALPFDNTPFEKPPVGFYNESNYCFMHAALQGLLSVEQLNCWIETEGRKILENSQSKDKVKQSKWLFAYSQLMEAISAKKAGSFLKIQDFKSLVKTKFDPKYQHDCQEFIRYFLEQLHQEIRLEDENCQSITDILFQGQMLSQLTCQNQECQNVSSKFENFLDLSLSMHNMGSIEECLKDFFGQETLSDNYYCESCSTHTSAIKKFLIGSSPTILLIHLKRFNMFPKKVKLYNHVHFPLTLKIDEYGNFNNHNPRFSANQFDNNYTLRSIVVHYGTPEKGHYVTFSFRQKNWYFFDDHKVYQVLQQDILQQQAYLLFYEKTEDLMEFSGN